MTILAIFGQKSASVVNFIGEVGQAEGGRGSGTSGKFQTMNLAVGEMVVENEQSLLPDLQGGDEWYQVHGIVWTPPPCLPEDGPKQPRWSSPRTPQSQVSPSGTSHWRENYSLLSFYCSGPDTPPHQVPTFVEPHHSIYTPRLCIMQILNLTPNFYLHMFAGSYLQP